MNLLNYLIPTKKNNYKPYLLRKVAVAMYCFILVFVNSLGGLVNVTKVEASGIVESKIVELTNKERQAYGLNTLTYSAELSAAALAKANNMLEQQYWDHYGPNGETPWQFIRAAGYDYVYAGENLAKGFSTSEGVVEAWMASPSHKANIVSGNYKEIGVAVVDGELLGRRTTLVVQMFGNRTADVYGVVEPQTQPVVTPTPSVPETQPVTQPTQPYTGEDTITTSGNETGEIKSIMITSPVSKAVVTNASENIKGTVEATEGSLSYKVDVYDNDNSLGSVESTEQSWSFSKGSDWAEGEHNISANVDGTDIKANTTFTVDTTAPKINLSSIMVKDSRDNLLTLSFNVTEKTKEAMLISGTETYEISIDGKDLSIELSKEDVEDKVVTVKLADDYGNMSTQDISEYFMNRTTDNALVTGSISPTRWISIGVVAFALILLIIEMIFYIKKGWYKKAMADALTVSVLWIVLAIAIFNGYSGTII